MTTGVSLVDMKQAAPEDLPVAEVPKVTTPFTTTVSGPPPSERPTAGPKDYSHLNSAECGTRTALTLRITFGQDASPGQFPWAASLQYRRRAGGRAVPLCGGALVSSRHVVTAAHCHATQSGFQLSSVRLGQVDISGPVAGPGQELPVHSVLSHPGFTQSPVAIMDIALVLLQHLVTFTDHVRPVCLHHPDLARPDGALTVAGWGRTHRATSSPLLQFTTLAAVPRAECQAEYSQAAARGELGPGIPALALLPSQLCARGPAGTDSCSGDSGGPLMMAVDNVWYLAGVVSFGTQRCDSSLPGVYTALHSFWGWLESAMGPL